ncbi:MAG: zinc metallopeptidase, partial [Firmicutes bacterium]|nr:zinc metallopeptidase [Bacillota bacterium]
MPYYIDITYIILVVPAIIFSLIASAKVNTTFRKYEHHFSKRGVTGRQAAMMVLQSQGIHNVQITRTSGKLTDHYDPRS